uniref:Uncharacterized protein n=1 Tax=Octactis speculum TaxID=3111310 RepID=A0A7S2HJ75_9STRA
MNFGSNNGSALLVHGELTFAFALVEVFSQTTPKRCDCLLFVGRTNWSFLQERYLVVGCLQEFDSQGPPSSRRNPCGRPHATKYHTYEKHPNPMVDQSPRLRI